MSTQKLNRDVRAENLIVAGVVEGDLYVSRKLELESTARITGNVSAAAIAIAEGAIIDGKLETTEDSTVTSFSERRTSWITALIRQFFDPRSRDVSTEPVVQSPADSRASRKE